MIRLSLTSPRQILMVSSGIYDMPFHTAAGGLEQQDRDLIWNDDLIDSFIIVAQVIIYRHHTTILRVICS
jgi:hypothetical protein